MPKPTTRHQPVVALRQMPNAAGTEYELLIYGVIDDGWWDEGVTALAIVQELNAMPEDTTQINVRINSIGGRVDDGLAIYNALRRNPARKVVTVDGVAHSISSLIAMAGDEVLMPATSMMMIHAPMSIAIGNATQMRKSADDLDQHASAMVNAYAHKTGKSKDDVIGLLSDDAEHYYTGEQAVAAGFADRLIEDTADEDDANATAAAQAVAHAVSERLASAGAPMAAMAVAAASRHPVALPAPAKPRIRVTNSVDPNAASVATDPAAQTIVNIIGRTPATTPAAPATSEDTTMPNATTAAPTAADIHAQLRERNDEIRAVLEPYMQRKGVNDLLVQALADPTASVDTVRAQALELVGRDTTPNAGPHIEMGEDESDKFRAGVSQALMARAGLAEHDKANEFRGLNLREIARACAKRAGKSTSGMDVRQVVATAFTSTDDFPLLLANTAQAALLKGFEESAETFPLFTSAGTLTDFKEMSKAGIGFFSGLDEVPEGGEYKYGTFGERGQKLKLATYGKLFAITRQAVINDDLGAFTDVPRKMGRAAKRTIGNLVFGVLTENAAMADGKALFHADHSNLLTAGKISTDTVDAMSVAMATQKLNGQPINVQLAHLIVPMALRGAANVVRDSEFEVGATARNNTVPNSVRGTFDVIADARLDKASAKTWYAAADASQCDVIEVSYLDGQQAPYLEQKQGWDVDGTEFKVRIDAGVKELDYRGLAKNPGA